MLQRIAPVPLPTRTETVADEACLPTQDPQRSSVWQVFRCGTLDEGPRER
jgi:hypothetical protein